jgi:hypothetical protein
MVLNLGSAILVVLEPFIRVRHNKERATITTVQPFLPSGSDRQDPPRSNGASERHRKSYLARLRHAEHEKKTGPKSGPVFGYVNWVERLPHAQIREDLGNEGRRKVSVRLGPTDIDSTASGAPGVSRAH